MCYKDCSTQRPVSHTSQGSNWTKSLSPLPVSPPALQLTTFFSLHPPTPISRGSHRSSPLPFLSSTNSIVPAPTPAGTNQEPPSQACQGSRQVTLDLKLSLLSCKVSPLVPLQLCSEPPALTFHLLWLFLTWIFYSNLLLRCYPPCCYPSLQLKKTKSSQHLIIQVLNVQNKENNKY